MSLAVQGLVAGYGDITVLDGVGFEVAPTQIVALLGANGAGKTTLINLFLSFLDPSSGSIRINGRDVASAPLESKQDVAYIPEQVMLYGVLTGLENLQYLAALATGTRPSRGELLGLLADVGLDAGAADRRVSTYSKGMRQKVGIAIALAKQARALLLDEPTSGLDPKAASEFSDLLKRASARGVAVLTTTHDLFHATQTGTRIGIMRQGEIVADLERQAIDHADLQALYLQHMQG